MLFRNAVSASVLFGVLAMAGCGDKQSEAPETPDSPPTTSTTRAKFPADTATATVSGSIILDAPKAPTLKKIKMAGDDICVAAWPGGKGPSEKLEVDAETMGIKNAVVYIKEADQWKFKTPAAVTLAQGKCVYTPHAIVLMTGQTITITNKDKTGHNVHWMGKKNKLKNASMTQAPGAKNSLKFKKPELGAFFKCDIHSWMRTNVCIFKHPMVAITDAQGNFTLPKLPAGSYTVSVWHETLGRASARLTLADGASETVVIKMKKE